jgi:integrase
MRSNEMRELVDGAVERSASDVRHVLMIYAGSGFMRGASTVRDLVAQARKARDRRNRVNSSPGLVVTLKRHLALRRQESLQAGTGELEWLFLREDGSPLDKDHVAALFRRLLRIAKLCDHRVYDLRHTFACLLLVEGADLPYVAAQMGHKNPATTLRWYARWIRGHGRRWVDLLDTPASGRMAVLEPESGTTAAPATYGARK